MIKQQLEQLTSGVKIYNKRNGEQFLVEDVDTKEQKILVLSLKDNSEKTYAYGSVRRNMEILTEEEVKPEVTANDEVPEVASEVVKDIPKPEKSKTVAKPKNVESVSTNTLELSNQLRKLISKEFPNAKHITNTAYEAYKDPKNFVELNESKRGLSVTVKTKALNEEQIEKLSKVYPKSNGWVLDGKFVVKDADDLVVAMDLISASRSN